MIQNGFLDNKEARIYINKLTMISLNSTGFEKSSKSGPSEPGGAGGLEPPNNCQTVVYFLHNSVLNEKECNGQPPNMKFVPTAL